MTRYYTTRQVAKIKGVHRGTVAHAIKEGILTGCIRPGYAYLVPETALKQWHPRLRRWRRRPPEEAMEKPKEETQTGEEQ
jgi:excisionase family DNA binding protein